VVRAFAPATVANVVVGFDVLGHALDGPGDEVEVEVSAQPGVVIERIEGATGLPLAPEKNTAGMALLHLIRTLELDHGFRVRIAKGLPAASGMGSSAASAVAAVVAASAVVAGGVSSAMQLDAALAGEAVASGSRHADNVAPALFGGLVLSLDVADGQFRVAPIPAPPGVVCAVVRPDFAVATSAARSALRAEVPLSLAVRQSAHLAAFVTACHSGDLGLLRHAMRDLIVGPQRSALVPGFKDACAAAREAGALGCSFAGAGPSLMAWVEPHAAAAVVAAVRDAFARFDLATEHWVSPIDAPGARVL